MKICVCTAFDTREPRAVRHAVTLARMNPDHEVVFVDTAPCGATTWLPKSFDSLSNLTRRTIHYPHRRSKFYKLLPRKLKARWAQEHFKRTGHVRPDAIWPHAPQALDLLNSIGADLYVAHCIQLLLPAFSAAQRNGAKLIFDCMEFYSDMGDGQTDLERIMIDKVERACLGKCDLVLASSDSLADALMQHYGISRPLVLYNTPSIATEIPDKPAGFTLYWRNTVIGFGQRGLDDLLLAMRQLPSDVVLHLRGNLSNDGGAALRAEIQRQGLAERVVIHPPHTPDEAVIAACGYTIGICAERPGLRNHELTVSNKIFDYMMAGLAVIASDMPSLRLIVERSDAGLLFEPGSADDLARQIRRLYEDRALLNRMSANARVFALSEGNVEHDMERFRGAVHALLFQGSSPQIASQSLCG